MSRRSFTTMGVLLVVVLGAPPSGMDAQARGEGPSGGRPASHYPAPWVLAQNRDEDRWKEASERMGRLRFEGQGNWQENEGEGAGGGVWSPSEEIPAPVQRLREEGRRREHEARIAWERRAREIYAKWGGVREPTPSVYVAYTPDNEAFGEVDYRRGFLQVGAIAPALLGDGPARIERSLVERLCFLLRLESQPGLADLAGQVRFPDSGRWVTPEEARQFARRMARSGGPPQAYTAPDGVRRLRKQVKIDLVPDHLQTRVQRYLPYVHKAARVYGVAPELILAVIHTESVFNPGALSPAGAVGLMQLVPSAGALEASKLVYGEHKLLTREELARPDKNIELGAAYLRILLNRHFGAYRGEPRKRLYLAIASYNCGPRRVKQALDGQDTRDLSEEAFYELLRRVVPPETQTYLERVVRNMQQYETILGRGPGRGVWIVGLAAGLPDGRHLVPEALALLPLL